VRIERQKTDTRAAAPIGQAFGDLAHNRRTSPPPYRPRNSAWTIHRMPLRSNLSHRPTANPTSPANLEHLQSLGFPSEVSRLFAAPP